MGKNREHAATHGGAERKRGLAKMIGGLPVLLLALSAFVVALAGKS
jgi:hypothetical protein